MKSCTTTTDAAAGGLQVRPPFQFLSMDFLRASLWTLYGLPHGLFYGLSTVFSTDTLRASLRFFPRARAEAGEWRRKPHVKVPSPRTTARRMSPRPFHGARQIGGRDAARTPYGCPHGRQTREARAARRMSLRTFYGARQTRAHTVARAPSGRLAAWACASVSDDLDYAHPARHARRVEPVAARNVLER